MKQLELRSYTQDEMAQLTGYSKESTHLARDVKNKLNKWGYTYIYKRSSVTITKRPETSQERFAELMLRQFELDVQINVDAFAHFIFLLLTDEGFGCMPWAERENEIFERFGIDISDSTLRKWASRLLGTEIIYKSRGDKVYWRTERLNNVPVRNRISEDDEEYLKYKARKSDLIIEYTNLGLKKNKAWREAFKQLWREFGCCYYHCPRFVINALGHDIDEVITWTEEICGVVDN